jgi:hypothetical protein
MANDEAIKAWYSMRVRAVHDKITVHDILRRNGVTFRHANTDREEQVSCPFHGKDENPSARVYPTTPRSPSHVWCFVCRERWDVITLWKKYSDGEGKSFHRLLSELEKLYGIPTPPVPEGAFDRGGLTVTEQEKQAFEQYYQFCEQRLTGARDDYVRLQDMTGYLIAGSILDKVYYQVGEGLLPYKDGLDVLKRLIAKMGDRIRGVTAN